MKRSRPTAPEPPSVDGARHATHLRGLNLERVLAVALNRSGPFTRAELIRATGLSAPTVGSLASHLIRLGLVTDLGTGPSRGGRRPAFMQFNARHAFVAGIDLGPTHTRLAIADLRGDLLAHDVIPTPAESGPPALLAHIARETRRLLRDADVPLGRLLAVGAGAPGVVDRKRGMVVALAPNLKGWTRVPMGTLLRRALGAPVVVENDVNLAILGERWRGAARGHDTCVFITAGTGIGAGVIVGGELHHGCHSMAGEIGLMCMGPQFVETDFGARGCLETLAGLKALAARWVPPGSRAPADLSTIGALFEAAQNGDHRARRVVDEVSTLIGIAAANLSVALDPSLIVLGGALITHGGRPVIEQIRRTVARIVPTPSPIVETALGVEAPMWGAVLVATAEARERIRLQLKGAK